VVGTNSSIFEWYSRLDEHHSRRPELGFGKPPHSSEGTDSTWDITSRGYSGKPKAQYTHKTTP
jgi:hypothetical protein